MPQTPSSTPCFDAFLRIQGDGGFALKMFTFSPTMSSIALSKGPPPTKPERGFALRCVGERRLYSVVHLQDEEGVLRPERALMYF